MPERLGAKFLISANMGKRTVRPSMIAALAKLGGSHWGKSSSAARRRDK